MERYNNGIFGKRLSKLLVERGMTHREFAKKMMFSQATVSRWCSENRMPRGRDLADIALALDVSADYLLGLSDCRTRQA